MHCKIARDIERLFSGAGAIVKYFTLATFWPDKANS
jgi:hypothetical protein